jgi:hypothetical protein
LVTAPPWTENNWFYFAGVAAVVAGFAVVFLADFLLCFTCFLTVGAVLGVAFADGVAGAGACAARVNPAVARVNVRPRTADVIFRMSLCSFSFEARSFSPSVMIDVPIVNQT